MSSEKVFTVDAIPEKAIIKIEVSGGFYIRLVQHFLNYVGENDPRKLPEVLEALKKREPNSPYEYHLMTLLVLIKSIEDAATEQNLITKRDLKAPDDTQEKSPES